MNWMKEISLDELKYMAVPLLVFPEDIEAAASYMYKEGRPTPMASLESSSKAEELSKAELESRPSRKYWEAIKVELRILICTDAPKYSKLREQLTLEGKNGARSIIALVSASIGSVLGIKATLITGLCALAVYAAVKVSKEAYCTASQT